MKARNEKAWTWRPPRVRFEPPTMEEAMVAARGMTDDREEQLQLAAGLMGVSVEAVKREYPDDRGARGGRTGRPATIGARTIIVERKLRRTRGVGAPLQGSAPDQAG